MMQIGVIDADGHINEPVDLWDRYLDSPYREMAPRFTRTVDGVDAISFMGVEHIPANGIGLPGAGLAGQKVGPRTMHEHRYAYGHPGGFDPNARLAVMDKEGLDVAVLFPTISAIGIAIIPDDGFATALARGYNNWLAEFCAVNSRRLYGAAQVPLLHLDSAIREAERAVRQLGLKLICLRPNPYGERPWIDRDYDAFWSCIQDLNVPIAFHEGTYPRAIPTAGADRYDNFLFQHVVSHPFEQQLVCLNLIAGGILERFPRLRVGFMEAGSGWLPYWLDRIDEHFEQLAWMVPEITMKPSAYFQRQCFVSTEPKDGCLSQTVSALGPDQLLFASDFPHYDAVFPGAVDAFRSHCGVDENAKSKILTTNAMRFLGLSPSDRASTPGSR